MMDSSYYWGVSNALCKPVCLPQRRQQRRWECRGLLLEASSIVFRKVEGWGVGTGFGRDELARTCRDFVIFH